MSDEPLDISDRDRLTFRHYSDVVPSVSSKSAMKHRAAVDKHEVERGQLVDK
jgi:hypothetical protein